jgi:L-lactate dehydrogenase complex protein LldE
MSVDAISQRSEQSGPALQPPKYVPGQPVALFMPCYIDQFFPAIGRAVVRLLKRYGVPMVFPEGQTCCGQPAFNSGYWEEARTVIRQFCKAFADQQWIVCPSGSCTAMCRVFFGHVDPRPEIVEVGRRVVELTEFLVDHLGVTDTGATFPYKVTMHSGCHGRRELGILDQPLKLVRSVKGLEYVELPDIDECCGFGGTFSVKMPGMSLAMGESKVKHILETGADAVVSIDISCLMHVGGILKRKPEGKRVRVMHIAELLVEGWEEDGNDR